jgi:hypothetical protein
MNIISAGIWALNHWKELGELIIAVVAFYNVIRAHQWDRLVVTAGDLAYDAANLAGLDKTDKQKHVAGQLYALANPLARKLFSEAQFAMAVETGWKLIAKPRMAKGTQS